MLVGFCSDQITTKKEKSFNRAPERGSQREKVRVFFFINKLNSMLYMCLYVLLLLNLLVTGNEVMPE